MPWEPGKMMISIVGPSTPKGVEMIYYISMLVLIEICFLIRNHWVYKNRIKWIEQDVFEFQKRAISYSAMLFQFWIWDMKKFGFVKKIT
jgi:hypothetical protein